MRRSPSRVSDGETAEKEPRASRDEFCIAAGCDEMRAGFGRNLLQDLAQDFGDQPPVAVNRAGAHGLRSAASDGLARFTEAQRAAEELCDCAGSLSSR